MRITITMQPHAAGTTVNVRTDGAPANNAQEVYFAALRAKITEAVMEASDVLKSTGCVADFQFATGEEARRRGEARDGVPGKPFKN